MNRIRYAVCSLRLSLILLFTLVSGLACSAGLWPTAPTDQIIQGPFTLTTDWQTITFKKPLKTIPHIQYLKLLLDPDQYRSIDNIRDDFNVTLSNYTKIGENKPIQLSAVFVDQYGRQFRPIFSVIGIGPTDLGVYKNIGFGPNSDQGKFYYPKDNEIVALKIKANMVFRVEHLSWTASNYYQRPNKTWADVHASEIVEFK